MTKRKVVEICCYSFNPNVQVSFHHIFSIKKVINTVLPFTIFYFICKGDFAYMLYLSTAQMQCLLMQKALDLLELELEMTVNCHVGARIEPRSSGKATSMISH